MVCGLNKNKIKYSIVCFTDSSIESVKKYWNTELITHPVDFGKVVKIPPQGKGTYKSKSLYGVCTITVSNVKLKNWLLNKINNYKPG